MFAGDWMDMPGGIVSMLKKTVEELVLPAESFE